MAIRARSGVRHDQHSGHPRHFRLRAVIYDDDRGGYIHNIPGDIYPLADRYRRLILLRKVPCRREAPAFPTRPGQSCLSIR